MLICRDIQASPLEFPHFYVQLLAKVHRMVPLFRRSRYQVMCCYYPHPILIEFLSKILFITLPKKYKYFPVNCVILCLLLETLKPRHILFIHFQMRLTT